MKFTSLLVLDCRSQKIEFIWVLLIVAVKLLSPLTAILLKSMVAIIAVHPVHPAINIKAMVRYQNRSGGSGVYAYETGANYITVKFSGTSRSYTYSNRVASITHVDNMKMLAARGQGLNSYINRYVKYLYDR